MGYIIPMTTPTTPSEQGIEPIIARWIAKTPQWVRRIGFGILVLAMAVLMYYAAGVLIVLALGYFVVLPLMGVCIGGAGKLFKWSWY